MSWLIGWVMRLLIFVGMPLLAIVCIVFGAWGAYDHIRLDIDGVPAKAKIVSLDLRVEYDDGRRARYDLVFRVDDSDRDSPKISISEEAGDRLQIGQALDVVCLPGQRHVARWSGGPGLASDLAILVAGLGLAALMIYVFLSGRGKATAATDVSNA